MGTIIVLANINLAARIAEGRYEGYINPSITEENFPHDSTSVGEWKCKLFCFRRGISSEAAESAIAADGWMVGKLEHLLSFEEKYPDKKRKYRIVALGSSCDADGIRSVPILCGNDSKRNVDLYYWVCSWLRNYRLLAVRRVVSKI